MFDIFLHGGRSPGLTSENNGSSKQYSPSDLCGKPWPLMAVFSGQGLRQEGQNLRPDSMGVKEKFPPFLLTKRRFYLLEHEKLVINLH